MDTNIKNSEKISRYIFSKKHCSVQKEKLKYAAFMPPTSHPNEISVYRISNLKESEIWDIGIKFVAEKSNRQLFGRGDMKVSDIV